MPNASDSWTSEPEAEGSSQPEVGAGAVDSTSPPESPEGSARLRWGALLFGFLLSAVLSAALVIATAKAGISPGVSPLVVLFGWVIFGRSLGPRLKGFLALAQVSGSGGAAVSAGAIFTAPILQVYYRNLHQAVPTVDLTAAKATIGSIGPAGWAAALSLEAMPAARVQAGIPAVDIVLMMIACGAGALLGWGFVGFGTRRFLSDPKLPAPEAVACDRLINTAAQNASARPAVWTSLGLGLVGGFLLKAAIQFKWLSETVANAVFRIDGFDRELPKLTLPLPVSPLLLGIGALLTLPTAILIFGGAVVHSITVGITDQQAALPETTFRWVGGAAMTVAVLYSLLQYTLAARRARRDSDKTQTLPSLNTGPDDPRLLLIPRGKQALLWLGVLAGASILVVSMAQAGMEPKAWIGLGIVAVVLISLLSGLGGLLSLQVGSSASPVSGTVFMAMLVLSLTALGLGLAGASGIEFLVPILVATCVAICAANDSSQDYKTMQLNEFVVHRSFGPQLVGLLGGCVAVPIALSIADQSGGLGSADLPCPQASFFATVLQTLFGAQQIPWGPCLAGVVLGVVAVAIEAWGRRRGIILSSLAFAVGIYLPAEMGIGILIGAIARRWGAGNNPHAAPTGILTAAGLITGYALLALVFGLLTTGGLDMSSWFNDTPQGTSGFLGLVVLVFLVVAIAWNYGKGRTKPEEESR